MASIVFKNLGGSLTRKLFLNSGAFSQNSAKRRLGQCKHEPGLVRVRFAPSPTGLIHLGGLRTAFYNYLFARKNKGKFILRIEDTDQERIVPGSFEHILDTLKWSNMAPDEGPTFGGHYGSYIQSERADFYQEMIGKLLDTKAVYQCFCTPKRLDLLRREAAKNRETIKYDNRCRFLSNEEVRANIANEKPYTIRLRLKEGPLTINDLVYGKVTYDLSQIEGDPILIKSDGLPTYHFASVVDDHLMQISHVLRGVEWLTSTPKHLMIYEAFGWDAPKFAHLPLIINQDGTKLSKRHDHIRIDTFRYNGFYPETVTNYLTQMGGGFGALKTADSDQIYTLDRLSTAFKLESVNQNNCRIDTDKIKLLNRLVIQNIYQTDLNRLVGELRQLLSQHSSDVEFQTHLNDTDYIFRVIKWSLSENRIHSLKELTDEQFLFLWSSPKFTWSVSKIASPELTASTLRETIATLKSLSDEELANNDILLSKLRGLHERLDKSLKFSVYMKLLRFGLTNLKEGSPVTETINLLGRERTIQYLERAQCYVHSSDHTKEQTWIQN